MSSNSIKLVTNLGEDFEATLSSLVEIASASIRAHLSFQPQHLENLLSEVLAMAAYLFSNMQSGEETIGVVLTLHENRASLRYDFIVGDESEGPVADTFVLCDLTAATSEHAPSQDPNAELLHDDILTRLYLRDTKYLTLQNVVNAAAGVPSEKIKVVTKVTYRVGDVQAILTAGLQNS